MMIEEIIQALKGRLAIFTPGQYYLAASILFLAIVVVMFLFSPLPGRDSDLWYHLNGGKQVAETGQLANDSGYFSFVSPPRTFTKYFWLFQVLVYEIHKYTGYTGIIVLMGMLLGSTAALILLFILKMNKKRELTFFQALFFFVVVAGIIPRFQLARPHAFSYLLTIVFIFILELKPRLRWLLPLLGLFWVNVHGVEYPVMILICLAYLFESGIKDIKNPGLKGKSFRPGFIKEIAPIVATMYTILLTPYGTGLLGVPFTSTEYASIYIHELNTYNFPENFIFVLTAVEDWTTRFTFINITLLLVAFALILSVKTKRWRVSHIILAVGGLFLFSRSLRFFHELAYLSLPLMAMHFAPKEGSGRTPGPLALAATLAFLFVLTIPFVSGELTYNDRYPVLYRNLPAGVARFLNKIDTGGNVLNNVDSGGYMQWELDDKYRIHMDMEVPFFFSDMDLYRNISARSNKDALQSMLSEYSISFISVKHSDKKFPGIIKDFIQFVPVFFDDSETLYVNNDLLPEVALEFALKHISPGSLNTTNMATMPPEERQRTIIELERLHRMYPHGITVSTSLSYLYSLEGKYDMAISHAENHIRLFPPSPGGYMSMGEALLGKGDYAGSEKHFHEALERADETVQRNIYSRMFTLYQEQDKTLEAYTALKKAIGHNFYMREDYRMIYNLGVHAMSLNKADEALLLMRIASTLVPEDDKEMRRKVDQSLTNFE